MFELNHPEKNNTYILKSAILIYSWKMLEEEKESTINLDWISSRTFLGEFPIPQRTIAISQLETNDNHRLKSGSGW